ncbi:MAG: GC-type dockerin domain-anchored protein [Phycisphaerales bacterium]
MHSRRDTAALLSTCVLAALAGTALADPQEVQSFAGPYPVYTQGNPANATLTATFTTQGYPPGALNITLDMSAVNGAPDTLASDVIVSVTPPTGDTFEVSMGPPEPLSELPNVTQVILLNAGIEAKGTWTFRIYDSSQNGDGIGAEEFVSNVRVGLEAAGEPSALENFVPLPDGTTQLPSVFHSFGGVEWYRMVVPALDDAAHPRYLDILTAGQFADTYIAMYDDTGRVRATDDDSGTGHASFLSFGYGGGAAVGGGGPSDFQMISDGRSGKLAAGVYWLVISEFGGGPPVFAPGWRVMPPPEGSTYQYALTLVLGDTPGGGSPPAAESLGTLAFPQGSESEVARTVIVPVGQPAWLSFTLTDALSSDAGTHLDITSGSAISTVFDSELGLYSSSGVLVAIDDDEGADLGAFISLGAGGGTTTGSTDTATTRSDGRDGSLPAGTYYLAAAEYNTTFGNAFATTLSFGEGGGSLDVTLRSGRVEQQSGCGPADLGAAGGVPGSDGQLNNNDFIAFISYFFAGDAHADLGVAGGLPGSDGHYDNNDFIAFISFFFAGC